MAEPTTRDGSLDRRGEDGSGADGDGRAPLRARHAHALTMLLDERSDLRGVHALADYFDDAVRWSA